MLDTVDHAEAACFGFDPLSQGSFIFEKKAKPVHKEVVHM